VDQPQSIALFFPEIRELLAEKNYSLLKQVLKAISPLDFADVWKKFTEEERLQIFKLLPSNSALKLFEILPLEEQRHLLAKLNEENVTPILDNLDSPDLAKIFHRMPPRAVKKMTSLIKRQEALAHIDTVMKYPEKTAGSLMHPEFVKLSPRTTAKQALSCLSAIMRPGQKEHLYSLYVTDEQNRLMGTLTLQDLVAAPEDERLHEMMTSIEQIKISPETDQEEVSKLFSKYQLTSAPVVDKENKLIGVLTVGDIISVVRQEAAEDIAKMAGTRATELNERSAFRIVRFRSPWLIVTLIGGTLISMIIKSFEPLLSEIIALASFSPLIAGMGGNVGSQSATVVVRQLALEQVGSSASRLKIILRELGVGILMGTMYGLVLGLIAYLFYGQQYGYQFSLVVGSAMFTAMTIAATMGAVGPLLFDNFGIDPATAAGPIVSTTTDIFSNLIYFSMAAWLLWHH
jgi:magnesium transporter